MRNIQKVYFLATLPLNKDFKYDSLEEKHFWQAYFYILDFFKIIKNNNFELFKGYVYSETLSYELNQIEQINDKKEALEETKLKELPEKQISLLINLINKGNNLEKDIINLSQKLYLLNNDKDKLSQEDTLDINSLQYSFSVLSNTNSSYFVKS